MVKSIAFLHYNVKKNESTSYDWMCKGKKSNSNLMLFKNLGESCPEFRFQAKGSCTFLITELNFVKATMRIRSFRLEQPLFKSQLLCETVG